MSSDMTKPSQSNADANANESVSVDVSGDGDIGRSSSESSTLSVSRCWSAVISRLKKSSKRSKSTSDVLQTPSPVTNARAATSHSQSSLPLPQAGWSPMATPSDSGSRTDVTVKVTASQSPSPLSGRKHARLPELKVVSPQTGQSAPKPKLVPLPLSPSVSDDADSDEDEPIHMVLRPSGGDDKPESVPSIEIPVPLSIARHGRTRSLPPLSGSPVSNLSNLSPNVSNVPVPNGQQASSSLPALSPTLSPIKRGSVSSLDQSHSFNGFAGNSGILRSSFSTSPGNSDPMLRPQNQPLISPNSSANSLTNRPRSLSVGSQLPRVSLGHETPLLMQIARQKARAKAIDAAIKSLDAPVARDMSKERPIEFSEEKKRKDEFERDRQRQLIEQKRQAKMKKRRESQDSSELGLENKSRSGSASSRTGLDDDFTGIISGDGHVGSRGVRRPSGSLNDIVDMLHSTSGSGGGGGGRGSRSDSIEDMDKNIVGSNSYGTARKTKASSTSVLPPPVTVLSFGK